MNNEIIFLSIILCSILILTIIFFLIYKYCVINHNQIVDDIKNQQDIIKFNPLDNQDSEIPSAPPYDVYYFNQNDITNKEDYFSDEDSYEDNDELDLGDYFLDKQNTYV